MQSTILFRYFTNSAITSLQSATSPFCDCYKKKNLFPYWSTNWKEVRCLFGCWVQISAMFLRSRWLHLWENGSIRSTKLLKWYTYMSKHQRLRGSFRALMTIFQLAVSPEWYLKSILNAEKHLSGGWQIAGFGVLLYCAVFGIARQPSFCQTVIRLFSLISHS